MAHVKFDRLSRNHNVPDLPLRNDGTDPDRVAEEVFTYARNFLVSRDVEVAVDVATRKVTVYAGIHVGGTGTIEEDT